MDKLPNELLLLIAEFVGDRNGKQGLLAMALVSRRLNKCSEPSLYRSYYNTGFGTDDTRPFWPFLRTMLARPELAAHVKRVVLRGPLRSRCTFFNAAPCDREAYKSSVFPHAKKHYRHREGNAARSRFDETWRAWELGELLLLLALVPDVEELRLERTASVHHRDLFWDRKGLWFPVMLNCPHAFANLRHISGIQLEAEYDREPSEWVAKQMVWLFQLPKLQVPFSIYKKVHVHAWSGLGQALGDRESTVNTIMVRSDNLQISDAIVPALRACRSVEVFHFRGDSTQDSNLDYAVQALASLHARSLRDLCICHAGRLSAILAGCLQPMPHLAQVRLSFETIYPLRLDDLGRAALPRFERILPPGVQRFTLYFCETHSPFVTHLRAAVGILSRDRFPRLRTFDVWFNRGAPAHGDDLQSWSSLRPLEGAFRAARFESAWAKVADSFGLVGRRAA